MQFREEKNELTRQFQQEKNKIDSVESLIWFVLLLFRSIFGLYLENGLAFFSSAVQLTATVFFMDLICCNIISCIGFVIHAPVPVLEFIFFFIGWPPNEFDSFITFWKFDYFLFVSLMNLLQTLLAMRYSSFESIDRSIIVSRCCTKFLFYSFLSMDIFLSLLENSFPKLNKSISFASVHVFMSNAMCTTIQM